jgi:hypothetical protein
MTMKAALYHWDPPSRPCLFALSLQEDSVFADFECDEDGRVYAVRVSFDGFGCCHTTNEIGKMGGHDSSVLLEMVATGSIDSERVDPIMRQYFSQNVRFIWADALREHDLL